MLVNSGPGVTVAFLFTGYSWDSDMLKNFRGGLSVFHPGNDNTIPITGLSSEYALDIDEISVV